MLHFFSMYLITVLGALVALLVVMSMIAPVFASTVQPTAQLHATDCAFGKHRLVMELEPVLGNLLFPVFVLQCMTLQTQLALNRTKCLRFLKFQQFPALALQCMTLQTQLALKRLKCPKFQQCQQCLALALQCMTLQTQLV